MTVGTATAPELCECTERPLDDERLMALIQRWPVPIKQNELDLDFLRPGGTGASGDEASAWESILRSKGNLWLKSRYSTK